MQYTIDQGVRSPLQTNLTYTRNFAASHNWLPTVVSVVMLLWIGLIFTNIHLSTAKPDGNPTVAGSSINHGTPVSYHASNGGGMAVVPVNNPPMKSGVVVAHVKPMTTSQNTPVTPVAAVPSTTTTVETMPVTGPVTSPTSNAPASSDPADCNCGNNTTGTSSTPVTSGDGDGTSSTGNDPAPTTGTSGNDGSTGTTITTPVTPPISIDPSLPPVSVPPVSVNTPVVSVGL